MRQLLTYCPPRMVSAKWTFQLSRSSTLASAAAMPPSAMTVCALPSSDLQTRPTDTPRPTPRWPPAAGKREHVHHAAMLDPHTAAELPLDRIAAMVDDLLVAHAEMLSAFA